MTNEENQEVIEEYNAAMCASNEAGYAGVTAAQTIHYLIQRAEAAEAKLAELEKQEAAGKFAFEPLAERYHHIKHGEAQHMEPKLPLVKLFTRPAPAINLAELVPDREESRRIFENSCHINNERNPHHPDFYLHLPVREKWDAWEACRAAIIRKIDEANI